MGEEHELKGSGFMGKKTPFYRGSRIQPLCPQSAHGPLELDDDDLDSLKLDHLS